MLELHHLTALEQLTLLRKGEVTPVELTTHYLDRIERIDGDLGAFTTVTRPEALARAAALEGTSKAALLWGLPIGDKDLERRAGVRTTFGSRAFEHFVPDETDEGVLVRDAAGAISLGKTAAPEFGLSGYTESRVGPPTRNPWNTALGAGGSSGGAAVAVAAGMLPLAPGSDGGGSVRIPAAACGLVGLKPSRGRIPSGTGFSSIAGLVAPGPLARTVGDAALLFDAMVDGGEYQFSTRAQSWNGGAYLNAAMRAEGRFQLGVMTTSVWDDDYEISIDPAARDALRVATEHLSALGHGLDEIALEPDPTYAPAFRTVWQAGAATIPVDGDDIDLLEPLTRWLLDNGRALSARHLAHALEHLTAFERSVIRQFSRFDAVLTPSLALTPRPIGWYDQSDPEHNFAQQVQYSPFTSFANVAGVPAITLPVHRPADGIPMGVQLVGRPGGEHTLLAIGAQLERRLRWHRWHPPQW
jgi:amidase